MIKTIIILALSICKSTIATRFKCQCLGDCFGAGISKADDSSISKPNFNPLNIPWPSNKSLNHLRSYPLNKVNLDMELSSTHSSEYPTSQLNDESVSSRSLFPPDRFQLNNSLSRDVTHSKFLQPRPHLKTHGLRLSIHSFATDDELLTPKSTKSIHMQIPNVNKNICAISANDLKIIISNLTRFQRIQVSADCKRLVSLFPISGLYHEQYSFWNGLGVFNETELQLFFLYECRKRFVEIIKSQMVSEGNLHPNTNLFVLDIKSLVGRVKANYFGIQERDLQSLDGYNVNRLSFNLGLVARDKYDLYMYRKGLMEFLYHNQDRFDFAIYADGFALDNNYHAITIELYYNWIYLVRKHDVNRSIKFKFVHTTSDKSMENLVSIIQKFNLCVQYSTMMVVSTLGHEDWKSLTIDPLKQYTTIKNVFPISTMNWCFLQKYYHSNYTIYNCLDNIVAYPDGNIFKLLDDSISLYCTGVIDGLYSDELEWILLSNTDTLL